MIQRIKTQMLNMEGLAPFLHIIIDQKSIQTLPNDLRPPYEMKTSFLGEIVSREARVNKVAQIN